ncbi:MAG: biotin transporter BioY [Elusimicrobiota bacterium]
MKTKKIVFISLFAVLTGVGALIIIPIPFSPVPITLQTLFCILSGAILGKTAGAASQAVYLAIGSAGLPIFSRGGSGFGYIIGPTGGYLLGFVFGSFLCGLIKEKGSLILGMISGIGIIYVMGAVQLKLVTGFNWSKSIIVGIIPFLLGDIIKIFLGYGVYKRLEKSGILEIVE